MNSWPTLLALFTSTALISGACTEDSSTWQQDEKAASRPAESSAKALRQTASKIRPLHKKLGKPRPGEWLATHEEAGQSFSEYLGSEPVTPEGKRHTIYIRPLGEFEGARKKIIEKTSAFLRLYFNLKITLLETLALSKIPASAKRKHPSWGDRQILSTYVLDEVLAPALPKDAAALICFTSSDLWPGPGWNFVFGQASLRKRVGVWSIYRNGDPERNADAFRLCLLRTLKTASHELGHMFSMQHCTAYDCNMCGSNHRAESDRRPLALCPECLPKLCWATATDPTPRARSLQKWCKAEGLDKEAKYYGDFLSRLTKPDKKASR